MAIVTLEDVRNEGVTVAMADDDKVNTYITDCTNTFNNTCQQWFEPLNATVTFDGDDSDTMFLQVPIISVTSVTDLETSKVINAEDYRVYNGRNFLQDDRRNPKLAMKNGQRFWIGRRRWEIVGSFGYTESDGSPPAEVKRAVLMFVIEKLLTPIVNTGAAAALPSPNQTQGSISEEVTDDHKVKYSNTATQTKPASPKANSGMTQNPYILEVMTRYRAPMKIRTQADWFIPLYPRETLIFSDVF